MTNVFNMLCCCIELSKHQKQFRKTNKINPFINKYNWKEINFPSYRKDCKKFESNDKSIALNILYIPYNTEEIRHVYQSKHNLNRENQVILLMITDGKKNGIIAL